MSKDIVDESYDLNTNLYRIRYFNSEVDLNKQLKLMKSWIKSNSDILVESIVTHARFDGELDETVFETSVVYLRGSNYVEA